MDMSETELPERDLKILELIVKRFGKPFILWILIWIFRQQKDYLEEQEAIKIKKNWEKDKKVKELTNQAAEKESSEKLQRKREQEKKEFYTRLEVAKKRLVSAQEKLEQVLQSPKSEKKVTFSDGVPAKVV